MRVGAAVVALRASAARALFPYLPQQPGDNKRVRALAPQIARLLGALARLSPSWCDRLRRLDTTPIPCAASRETVKRSDFAGQAAYGYCRSHSRYFWGFRLVLCAPPTACRWPSNWCRLTRPSAPPPPRRSGQLDMTGYTLIADKGFAGQDFETLVASLGATFLRPDRKNEPRRHGSLGAIRQWIESVFDTLKGQLSLERHGALTMPGLIVRIAQRLLAMTAVCWHGSQLGQPGRHLSHYDHRPQTIGIDHLVALFAGFDWKLAAGGELGRITSQEVVVRPPEVFVRPLEHAEATALKSRAKKTKHFSTRERVRRFCWPRMSATRCRRSRRCG